MFLAENLIAVGKSSTTISRQAALSSSLLPVWLSENRKENSCNLSVVSSVEKVKFIGKFLRSTGDYAGFIYKYPAIEDVATFNFLQIKKTFSHYTKYGKRGLLKFIINHK